MLCINVMYTGYVSVIYDLVRRQREKRLLLKIDFFTVLWTSILQQYNQPYACAVDGNSYSRTLCLEDTRKESIGENSCFCHVEL